MIDEGELRSRFPEIPWDQPVDVQVLGPSMPFETDVESEGNTLIIRGPASVTRWVCRYCIAIHGVKSIDVRENRCSFAFVERSDALDHIERDHHE